MPEIKIVPYTSGLIFQGGMVYFFALPDFLVITVKQCSVITFGYLVHAPDCIRMQLDGRSTGIEKDIIRICLPGYLL